SRLRIRACCALAPYCTQEILTQGPVTLQLAKLCGSSVHTQRKMAEASAADGKMKDLKISETKKNKKDGNPKTAAKKPQQQKKKIEGAALIGIDVAKEDDLGEWYQQVITKGQMISYYDVRVLTFPNN
ncbi:hypothetical protein JI435_308080, partial [Parastagonospora nodorum SN15]